MKRPRIRTIRGLVLWGFSLSVAHDHGHAVGQALFNDIGRFSQEHQIAAAREGVVRDGGNAGGDGNLPQGRHFMKKLCVNDTFAASWFVLTLSL